MKTDRSGWPEGHTVSITEERTEIMEQKILEDLKSLVLTEASTSDIEALAKVREKLIMLIKERTGEDSFVYEAENGHCPVRFQYGKGTEKILFIGHYDTVHLIGALKYYTEGNELHGPGVYDMKGGLISAIWTVKAYNSSLTVTRRPEVLSLPISFVSLRRTRRRRLSASRVQRTEI